MKIIKIQPKKTPKGEKPYPYFIFEDGKVGVQRYWKGNPSELLGFAKKPVAGDMAYNVKDFFFNPKQIIGLYPVFKNKDNKWLTSKDAIESIDRVRIVNNKKK